MNNVKVVENLANTTGFTKKDAHKAVGGLVDVITKSLVSNECVIITRFSKFEARRPKATMRIHPQTDQRIRTRAKTVSALKAGKNLKDAIAKKGKKQTPVSTLILLRDNAHRILGFWGKDTWVTVPQRYQVTITRRY